MVIKTNHVLTKPAPFLKRKEEILTGLGCPGAPSLGPALAQGLHGQGPGGEESCGPGRYSRC